MHLSQNHNSLAQLLDSNAHMESMLPQASWLSSSKMVANPLPTQDLSMQTGENIALVILSPLHLLIGKL